MTRVRPVVVLLGILALAVNLRAALAGYPPLLETVRVDLGLSAGVAGLVQAGAVLMMAAGSFAGPATVALSGTISFCWSTSDSPDWDSWCRIEGRRRGRMVPVRGLV